MLFPTSTLLALLATTTTTILALPGKEPCSEHTTTNTTPNMSVHVVEKPIMLIGEPTIKARQARCDVAYCQEAYQKCVKSCNSLNNSDCFNVVTSSSCEGCAVKICGPGCPC